MHAEENSRSFFLKHGGITMEYELQPQSNNYATTSETSRDHGVMGGNRVGNPRRRSPEWNPLPIVPKNGEQSKK